MASPSQPESVGSAQCGTCGGAGVRQRTSTSPGFRGLVWSPGKSQLWVPRVPGSKRLWEEAVVPTRWQPRGPVYVVHHILGDILVASRITTKFYSVPFLFKLEITIRHCWDFFTLKDTAFMLYHQNSCQQHHFESLSIGLLCIKLACFWTACALVPCCFEQQG